jgi:hypothetical protein
VIEARGDRNYVRTTLPSLFGDGEGMRLYVTDSHGPALVVTVVGGMGKPDETMHAVVEIPMAALRAALAAGGWTCQPMAGA